MDQQKYLYISISYIVEPFSLIKLHRYEQLREESSNCSLSFWSVNYELPHKIGSVHSTCYATGSLQWLRSGIDDADGVSPRHRHLQRLSDHIHSTSATTKGFKLPNLVLTCTPNKRYDLKRNVFEFIATPLFHFIQYSINHGIP